MFTSLFRAICFVVNLPSVEDLCKNIDSLAYGKAPRKYLHERL